MSQTARDIAAMVDMLPEEEQNLAYEMVKRLTLAWDPDFTKLTPAEERELEAAKASGYTLAEEIDWDAPE